MSNQVLSVDTEVVLLLCGRFGGERQEPFQPLSARDYGELAKWLNMRGLRPGDLMSASCGEHLQSVQEAKLERKRLEFLLGRGTAMALALERWSRGGLWVISRGDAEFPKRLKRHLKHAAPPLLYGAGNKELLNIGGLAIIGSRDTTEAALEFTRNVAAQCVREGLGVVSGGARGVDAAAMQGAIDAGGYTVGVLANDLLKTSVSRQSRLGLQESRLVLVSPFYPEAGFNAGNAMARNKYIYALSDRALVIDSALGGGGTWEGAVENLRQHWVPLYVRTPADGPGNATLIEKGGIGFTFLPAEGEALVDFFERTKPRTNSVVGPSESQKSFRSDADDFGIDKSADTAASPEAEEPSTGVSAPQAIVASDISATPLDTTPASIFSTTLSSENARTMTLDMYEDFLAKLTSALATGPLEEEQIAERLGLEKAQLKLWLKKACDSGRVERLTKPVRYSLGLQSSLLG